jgi:hypothetical protein
MMLFTTLSAIRLRQCLRWAGLSLVLATGSAQAQSGNALHFDGDDDYVSLPPALTTGVTSFTFEAWLNYQDNGAWTRVMDFGDNTTVNMFLTPRNEDNDAPRFAITIDGSAAEERLTGTTVLTAGQHHLAVTLSQNGTVVTGTLYVDGAVVDTNANMTLTPASLGTLSNLYLGRSEYEVDPYLKGELDEVRLYSTALSQAQVQADMRAGNGASAVPASLLAYYDFNQGVARGNNATETSLLDRSSNAYTGKLSGFALSGDASNWVGATAPLPVTLVQFRVERQPQGGVLQWATASEAHNAYFEVQRSFEGTSFQPLGRVAGAGTSRQSHDYQYLDAQLVSAAAAAGAPPVVYYRLRQVDTDGSSTYSPVQLLALSPAVRALAAFPTLLPAGQSLTLQVQSPRAGWASLRVTDALGRAVWQQVLALAPGTTSLVLPQATAWPAGVYAVRVQQDRWQHVTKVIRQ